MLFSLLICSPYFVQHINARNDQIIPLHETFIFGNDVDAKASTINAFSMARISRNNSSIKQAANYRRLELQPSDKVVLFVRYGIVESCLDLIIHLLLVFED